MIKEFKGKIVTTEARNISEARKVSEIQSLQGKPKTDLSAESVDLTEKVDEEIKKRFASGTILPAFKKISEPVKIDKLPPQKTATAETQNKAEIQKQTVPKGISIQIRQPIKEEKLVGDIDRGLPRAIGLVEELAEITVVDLQRWGGGQNTTRIIFDKINLLNEISLAEKAEGVHAWQRSPLAKLYLEIGQEALENKKSILQTIRERKNGNRPFLEIEDFEAIVELNRKLRF